MNIESAVALVDREVYRRTNKHLNDLQQTIVTKVWQGRKYWEIADEYGCTEGHAKDTGSLLWKLLSSAWGSKVTKGNFRSLIERQLEALSRELSYSNDPRQNSVYQIDNVNFIGRQQAIAKLQNLVDCKNKIVVIQGKGGVGKTTLAQQFLANGGFEITLEALMAKETSNVVSAAAVVEEWLQRDLDRDSGREFGVTLARLKRYLEQHRVGILLDNLEPALDRDGRFIAAYRNYIELLRILADPTRIGLALVNSYSDTSISLDPLISRLYRLITDLEDSFYNTGRFAYFMQMLGQIFFNHQQIEPARTIWHRAIAFSRSSHYTQIEAKSLIGLGSIERQAHNLAMAETYHQQAIELLEAITAKCDLAEAYFQWGLTLQSQHIAESKDSFTKAIALYQEIVAPKQVAKIDRLLNTLA